MEINKIIEEAAIVADRYNLKLVELDRTDNVINLKLVMDNELFIQIYGNIAKNKLNLALVFKQRRLYGYDSEGGEYHYPKIDFDFWGNLQVVPDRFSRGQRPFLRRGVYHQYGEEQKCADNEVW